MDGDITADYVVAELFDMGFEFSAISKAIEAVGPSLNDAIDFMLNGSYKNDLSPDTTEEQACSSFNCSASQSFPSRRQIGSLQSVDLLEQTKPILHSASVHRSDYQKLESDWEKKVDIILKTYFGFTSLKGFQKEALEAWLANKDCLILAATGSGKSLCFQIPALLTGKVVVVISPLISLMHDQCLKLAQHGVSACFLGSGQTDSSVEQKAMSGMYSIIYVCPETILRLVGPLQRLAESRGIALFAIDEVHCVSKWGHDFRPDYRRLSVLRESFNACNLKSKCDIPLMALTATATFHVREDILKSLHMSKETKIVLTSFYRPNLRFSVCHSRTSCISSYEKDFRELIDTYTTSRKVDKKESSTNFHNLEDESESSSASANANISDADERSWSDSENFEDDCDEGSSADICSENGSDVDASKENQMSVEYLEDELDIPQSVDDLDVSCGEFTGCSPMVLHGLSRSSETLDQVEKPDSKLEVLQGPLGQGPTIIYMPTRKETVRLAKYLCSSGVRAAAYHAKLPKKHLRNVHEKFHENILQVVVATIAFGMGIDKSNVRRIIHYGWPQSLEAYYQEAGRAGRDGKLADCTLYANLSRIPTLLPSKRSEEQTKQAMGLPSFYVLLIATLLITLHTYLGLAQSTPGSILTRPYFNSLISAVPSSCAGKSLYTYDAFIAATGSYSAFGTTGSDAVRKTEVAAFLANVMHETGSLCYTREINPQSNYCDSSNTQYPCAPGQRYFGRGPLQLSWNYNYGAAGRALGFNGLGNPDIVALDGNISFKTALWFWMSNSNCHNAMVTGQGFGATIRAINSGECIGGSPAQVNSRISFYRMFCQQFGVDPGPNLSC